jgi:hypothetical protein
MGCDWLNLAQLQVNRDEIKKNHKLNTWQGVICKDPTHRCASYHTLKSAEEFSPRRFSKAIVNSQTRYGRVETSRTHGSTKKYKRQ